MSQDEIQTAVNAEELEEFLIRYVPLARAAGVRVSSYDGVTLSVSAPLDKNINDKGTAFGGSLYNLCVIAGWGMTSIQCEALGLKGDIVVAKGEIEYLRPLRSELKASVSVPSAEVMAHFVESYERRGRASLKHDVWVAGDDDQPAAHFIGKYAIVK